MTLDAKRDEVDMGTMMERIADELGECRPKVDVDAKPLGATGVLGDILRWLTRAGFDRKLADPAPREIIRDITIEALVQAAPWGGGGLEFPNDYTVVVSEQTWQDFYSRDTAGICRQIEQAVCQRLSKKGGFAAPPRVSIAPDDDLGEGVWGLEVAFFRPEKAAEQDALSDGAA